MKKIIIFTLFIISLLHAKDLQRDKTLIEGELANGFKYTIKKNAKPKQTASFRLLVKVGSLEEDEDQRGVAHLVEHLAFNGSKNFKGNSLIKFLESLGVDFGSHLNASTGTSQTIYQLQVPLKGDNLEKSMLVFSDWAGGLIINQKELDKERGVVLEEERARNDSRYRIYKKMHKSMYKGSRYENRLPIGLKKVIKGIDLKRVKDFYETWYQPRFMNFVAVGDFDVKKMEKLIEKTFSSLKNSNKNSLHDRNALMPKDVSIEILKDKEVVKMSVSLAYVGKYKKLKTEKDYKSEFIKDLARRLFILRAKELKLSKNPAAKDIYFGFRNVGENLTYYTFYTTFVGNDGIKAFSQMANLIHEVKTNGFSKKNYEIVKKDIISSNEESVKNLKNQNSHKIAREIVYKKAYGEIYFDLEYLSQFEKRLLDNISIKEINEAFEKIVSIDKQKVYFVVPDDYNISVKQVQSQLANSKRAVVSKQSTKTLPDDIEVGELKPVKIASQTYNKKHDFYEFVLENGVKVVYKFNDYDKDKVLLEAFSKGGYSIYDTTLLPNAKMSANVVEGSGLGDFNFLEVEKIYADKVVEFNPFIDRYMEGFEGSSNAKDFKHLLKGIYLLSVHFKVDENQLFNEKKKMIERIKKEKNSPRLVYEREFKKFYYDNNKRFLKLDENDTKSINKDDILRIYKDRFSDFNNFTFFIIGDIKKDEVMKYSALYLGNLPTKKRDENFKDRGVTHIKGKHNFIKNINNQNASTISLSYKKLTPYSKVENARLIVLRDVLDTKLRELIREEKSGVYGVSVGAYFRRFPKDESVIKIYFMCEPKRRHELMKYVKNTIKEVIEKEVDAKYVNASIEKTMVIIDEQSKKNDFIKSALKKAYMHNDKILNADEYKKLYKSITPKIIKHSARKYFDTKDIIHGELNPKI